MSAGGTVFTSTSVRDHEEERLEDGLLLLLDRAE
jgi:hypothetical protein